MPYNAKNDKKKKVQTKIAFGKNEQKITTTRDVWKDA